jgi:hypothetical protein
LDSDFNHYHNKRNANKTKVSVICQSGRVFPKCDNIYFVKTEMYALSLREVWNGVVLHEEESGHHLSGSLTGQAWWLTPEIPALGRLGQEDLKFEASLSLKTNLHSKTQGVWGKVSHCNIVLMVRNDSNTPWKKTG